MIFRLLCNRIAAKYDFFNWFAQLFYALQRSPHLTNWKKDSTICVETKPVSFKHHIFTKLHIYLIHIYNMHIFKAHELTIVLEPNPTENP